jgi:hypothetical protein
MLEKVILGSSVLDAIRDTAATLRAGTGNPNDAWLAHGLSKMSEWAPRPPLDVTLEIGQSCDFPLNIFTASQLLFHADGGATFEDAIRETIKIGGENANRGSFIGSLLAAEAGSVAKAIPASWLNKTIDSAAIVELGERLASLGSINTPALATAEAERRVRSMPVAQPQAETPPGFTYPRSHPDDVKALVGRYGELAQHVRLGLRVGAHRLQHHHRSCHLAAVPRE